MLYHTHNGTSHTLALMQQQPRSATSQWHMCRYELLSRRQHTQNHHAPHKLPATWVQGANCHQSEPPQPVPMTHLLHRTTQGTITEQKRTHSRQQPHSTPFNPARKAPYMNMLGFDPTPTDCATSGAIGTSTSTAVSTAIAVAVCFGLAIGDTLS